METKKLITTANVQSSAGKTVLREIITQIIYFVLGIIVSRGAVMGSFSPFGISLAAAVPYKNIFFTAAGAALGYILLTPVDGFRYIAVLAAVIAVRWLLKDIEKVSSSRFFAPLAAALPLAATGLVLINVKTSQNSGLLMCAAEGVLAGAAAFFIKSAIASFTGNRPITSFSQREIACLIISACILLLSAGSLEIAGFSTGRILAVCIVLLCAKYGSVSGGSVAGIATGVVFGLSSSSFAFLCGCYSLGGLVAGLFAPMGRFAVAAAFAVCNCIMAFGAGSGQLVYSVAVEGIAGCVIFLLLPKVVGNIISAVFLPGSDAAKSESQKQALISRLRFASDAIGDVKECVNSVSERLKKTYGPQIDWIYAQTAQKVCQNCGLRLYCWEKNKADTQDDFGKLTGIIKRNGKITEKDIDENFSKKCCKQGEIAQSVNSCYGEYLSYEEAARRITQVRSVVAGQFSGLSEILNGLAAEFEAYTSYDTESSERICRIFNEMGLAVINCSCPINSRNIMTVEIEVQTGRNNKTKKSEILHAVCTACGRVFNPPCVSCVGDSTRLVFNQRPQFSVEIGTAQHISSNAELCGDSITYFNGASGDFVAIISDGMGTGGRAAVDSNMTTAIMRKLCTAGLNHNSALQIVNSALMVKSEDESLATVDLLSIDMFSGRAEIKKAGAAATYFRKNSKIIRKDMPSLPVGILNDIQFVADEISLTSGDLAVMISDGAVYNDDKWLENLIKGWNSAGTQELAQAVVDEAIKRRKDSHDDDITAVAVRLNEG